MAQRWRKGSAHPVWGVALVGFGDGTGPDMNMSTQGTSCGHSVDSDGSYTFSGGS